MERSVVPAVMLTLLLIGMLTLPFNIQLAEPSKSSVTEWNRTYGGLYDDRAFSLVKTSDGGYALAGSTSLSLAAAGDFWLVKVAEPTAEDMFGPLVLYIGLASTALIVAVVTAVYVTQKRRALKQKQSTTFAYIN